MQYADYICSFKIAINIYNMILYYLFKLDLLNTYMFLLSLAYVYKISIKYCSS